MFGVLSVVASAAIMKARNKTSKKDKAELQRLQEKEAQLQALIEKYKSDLEAEQQLKAQVEEKLNEATHKADLLQSKSVELEQEKNGLKMQNTVLMLENVILSDTKVKLERKTAELELENDELHNAVEILEEENEAAEAMLSKLKAKVGAIFDKYFSNEIDEQDAIRRVKELGLEITVDVPARTQERRKLPMATFTQNRDMWEPKLIMDNPERLQRLVAACMTPRGLPGNPVRPAPTTFPHLRPPQAPVVKHSILDAAHRRDVRPAAPAVEAPKQHPTIIISSPRVRNSSSSSSAGGSKRPTIVTRLPLDQVTQMKDKKPAGKLNVGSKAGSSSSSSSRGAPDAKALQTMASKAMESSMDDLSFGASKDVSLA